MDPVKIAEPGAPPGEWGELRGRVRHRAAEAIDLITILLQDAVILLAGFVAEFAYEHWLQSSHPFFQLAISLSSALFLLLYAVTVTVHIVQYVRGQFGAAPASMLGQYLPWALAAGGVVAAAVAVTVPRAGATAESAPPEMRTDIVTPATTDPLSFALSPDGRQLVFVASGDGPSRLWLRPLDSVTAQPLAGTEGARFPFWSPDSRAVAFFADSKLKRLDIGGGVPQTLADAPGSFGGTWSPDGVILFAPRGLSGLLRVPASGGEPVAVTTMAPRQNGHLFPSFLAGRRQFLFYVRGTEEAQGINLGSLDSADTTRLTAADTAGMYLPTGPEPAGAFREGGWLLYVRKGTLVARRFDAARGALSGDPVTVAESVRVNSDIAVGAFSVSAAGLVAYRTGEGAQRQLTWFDRAGTALGTLGARDENNLLDPELSPDGRRVAVDRTVQNNTDVWLVDAVRTTRLTFDPAVDHMPIWSPDGGRIVFDSARSGAHELYQKPSSGAGSEERLLESSEGSIGKAAGDWSPDGRFLLLASNGPKTRYDLEVLPMTGERTLQLFLQTNFQEVQGQFSPDGRWVAYPSNESGRFEVYVRPFSESGEASSAAAALGTPGGQWQVSTAGGISPRWRPDGKELYYMAPDRMLMAVPMAITGPAIEPGTPLGLFPTRIVDPVTTAPLRPQYDVAPDGRFLINTVLDEAAAPITLLQNWQPEAKQ